MVGDADCAQIVELESGLGTWTCFVGGVVRGRAEKKWEGSCKHRSMDECSTDLLGIPARHCCTAVCGRWCLLIVN